MLVLNNRRGSTINGFVGLLAVVLLVGAVLIGAYSTNTQPKTTTSEAAGRPTVDREMGLMINVTKNTADQTKYDVSASWKSGSQIDPNYSDFVFMVTVRKASDNALISGVDDRSVGQATSKTFTGLTLADGEYYVQLRMVPTTGSVYRQRGQFNIPLIPNSKNLISDGGFEGWFIETANCSTAGTKGLPVKYENLSSWTFPWLQGCKYSVSKNIDSHSGKFSLQIHGVSGGAVGTSKENLSLKSGERYTLSFWSKNLKSTYRKSVAVVSLTGGKIIASAKLTSRSEWSRSQSSFVVPSGINIYKLKIELDNDGGVLLDDVSLERF